MKTVFTDIKKTKQDLKKAGKEIAFIEDLKQAKFAGFKVSPSTPTDEQLRKINQFTRREFKAEELYVGQMRLAHNAIDRDVERFSEEVVTRFVNSAIRKTMLLDHDRSVKSAVGKFFDVELEKMPLQQANAETGQNLKLPAGITEVWFVSPWFYVPREGVDPQEIVKIDAGIYDWASIGFRAESIVPIRSTEKGKEDQILYWEYRGSGDVTEMTEGSLVYLGAQPGASVKSAGADDEEKGAVSYSPTTMAVEAHVWNANAAKDRLARWSSSDGSGDKDKIDWVKYRKAFGWFNAEDPENFGSYKLPHHDIIDGKLCVVWNGVSSAMAVCMGSMGGVDIPAADLATVITHLSKHYKQFDKEPPAKALTNPQGGNIMDWQKFMKMLQRLFPGKTFTEDGVESEMAAAMNEAMKKASDTAVEDATAPLKKQIKDAEPELTKVKTLDAEVARLTPLAADGKAFRDELVGVYVASKTKLKECGDKPEEQAPYKKMAESMDITVLKAEVASLKKRVDEKFPEGSELTSKEDLENKGKKPGEGKPSLKPQAKK